MINTSHVLEGLTHEQAWALGWADATNGDPKLSRFADDANATLTALLDRAYAIAPWDAVPLFDGEEV